MLRVAMLCVYCMLVAAPRATATCTDPRVLRYEPRTFLGYACEGDCERHRAGFRWGESHSVKDPRQCAPLPQPEAEGCAAYVDAGQDAEGAGVRWAVENEIVRPCQCDGAGERFRAGCRGALQMPADPTQ